MIEQIQAQHVALSDLEAGLELIRQSPKDLGVLEMIVRRPEDETREILEEGQLDPSEGLVGDNWRARGSSRSADGSAHPDMQITIMNARVLALVAPDRERWPLAGDQLVVDMDLSAENLPTGTRLALGAALLVVTAQPHTGCAKFMARFGKDALKFVSTPVGRQLNLRGIYAKVVQPGKARIGDVLRKLDV